MKIFVKSTPENWIKEENGTKPNTVRCLDGNDIIEVENTITGGVFRRTITDISVWKGNIIISWDKDDTK